MTAYHLATFRATPLCLFLFQEPLDALLFDEFEVFYHAHMVLGAVSLIEGFQPTTGKIFALIAKANKSFPKHFAPVTHMKTVLTAWQTSLTINSFKSLLVQIIFHRQITDTYPAIHPAGSNKLFFQFLPQPYFLKL